MGNKKKGKDRACNLPDRRSGETEEPLGEGCGGSKRREWQRGGKSPTEPLPEQKKVGQQEEAFKRLRRREEIDRGSTWAGADRSVICSQRHLLNNVCKYQS